MLACLFGRRTERRPEPFLLTGGPLPTSGSSHPRSPGSIYAVYTDYETPGDDVDGVYTLVIGRRIEGGGPVPPGQVTVTIPNSTRDIVTLADARPESVYDAWVDVWARKDLTRDYRADYEYYAPDGSIHLSIGVLSDT